MFCVLSLSLWSSVPPLHSYPNPEPSSPGPVLQSAPGPCHYLGLISFGRGRDKGHFYLCVSWDSPPLLQQVRLDFYLASSQAPTPPLGATSILLLSQITPLALTGCPGNKGWHQALVRQSRGTKAQGRTAGSQKLIPLPVFRQLFSRTQTDPVSCRSQHPPCLLSGQQSLVAPGDPQEGTDLMVKAPLIL